MIRPPADSTLFPYTTLFRSARPRPPAEPDATRRMPAGTARRPRRRPVRRVRRTVRHIDPVSVFKLSLFYYGCFLVLWLRSEEHTSELQSRQYLVCRLLLEKK